MYTPDCTGARVPRSPDGGVSLLAAAIPALAAGLLWAQSAVAEQAYGDAGCDLADGEIGTVTEIIDAVTVRLDSGLVVRLAGLLPPESGADAAGTSTALADLALGNRVLLRYGALDRDRYQRATAQLYVLGVEERWAQAELVSAGLALVSGYAEDRSCIAALLTLEREARAAGAGLWQHQMPRDAWSDAIRSGGPRFALVEGEIVSIGRTDRTVYLDFGRNWSTDFTVSMAVADAALIEAEGGAFDALVGRRIRVRGWLDEWDGPWIRVDHAEQIELLSEDDVGG